MSETNPIVTLLRTRFGEPAIQAEQVTADGVPTLWIHAGHLKEVLRYLKNEIAQPFTMLYDLCGTDERKRIHREGKPAADFSVVYYLTSLVRNQDVRLKVALTGGHPSVPSITDVWACADWYEREAYDMFGITFTGHPRLRRILMPRSWKGFPLRKEHHARATDMDPFELDEQMRMIADEDLRFHPEDWGLQKQSEDTDFMFLNLGPQHPGTHGLLRLVLQLDGEDIVDVVPDIGYHHRGAEKMGERQSWHTYIPYTDRVDYLGGVINNLAYLLPLEQLAGITLPDRAKVIRIMLSELFRISSHLVWYGTF